MAVVAVTPSNVTSFPGGGGHFWVYMQYVQALRRLGCEVFWLERVREPRGDLARRQVALLLQRLARFGLAERGIVYSQRTDAKAAETPPDFLVGSEAEFAALVGSADLLLNFDYSLGEEIVSRFKRTALVDIDPGLLQSWVANDQLAVAPHDLYVTIGETVGRDYDRIPDMGVEWLHIRPPVCLDLWPFSFEPACGAFTTVSSWWGGANGAPGEWVTRSDGSFYENNKRVAFLEYLDLPRMVPQTLELALDLGSGSGDALDRERLERHGWRITHARSIGRSPEQYRGYVQRSRGEFACVKPSCVTFQNAWISDRTICYLASGKPAIVENTGPSSYLPNGHGLFRFSTLAEAADALEEVDARYELHCRAAREIAEAFFDGRSIVGELLDNALADRYPEKVEAGGRA